MLVLDPQQPADGQTEFLGGGSEAIEKQIVRVNYMSGEGGGVHFPERVRPSTPPSHCKSQAPNAARPLTLPAGTYSRIPLAVAASWPAHWATPPLRAKLVKVLSLAPVQLHL